MGGVLSSFYLQDNKSPFANVSVHEVYFKGRGIVLVPEPEEALLTHPGAADRPNPEVRVLISNRLNGTTVFWMSI